MATANIKLIESSAIDLMRTELQFLACLKRPNARDRKRIAQLRSDLDRARLAFLNARDESLRLMRLTRAACQASPLNAPLWRGVAREHALRARREQHYAMRATLGVAEPPPPSVYR